MSSFTEEARIIVEQQQKAEQEAKEARELEGRVETLDEIAETIYNVIKENLLREIKEGRPSKEEKVEYSGFFRPKKITTVFKYVWSTVTMSLTDSAHLAVRHNRATYTNDDGEIIEIRDSMGIRLIDRKQYWTLKDILRQKFYADNIKCDFRWEKAPDEKEEKKDKKRHKYPEGYTWASVDLSCRYYLSEE